MSPQIPFIFPSSHPSVKSLHVEIILGTTLDKCQMTYRPFKEPSQQVKICDVFGCQFQ